MGSPTDPGPLGSTRVSKWGVVPGAYLPQGKQGVCL
ncbi:unnamed protein product, partial [Staurois parvus]